MDEIVVASFNLLRVRFRVADVLTEEWNNIEHDVERDLCHSMKYALQRHVHVQAPNRHVIVNRWLHRAANTMRQALERKIYEIPPGEDGNDVTLDMIIAFLEQDNYSYMQPDLAKALNELHDDRAWMRQRKLEMYQQRCQIHRHDIRQQQRQQQRETYPLVAPVTAAHSAPMTVAPVAAWGFYPVHVYVMYQ